MWIDMLLGRKRTEKAAHADGTQAGLSIQYTPALVPELHGEHQKILKALDQLRQAHALGDVAGTSALLEKFGSMLTSHLLKEDFRLYAYLEHSLAGDPATHEMVRHFHEELGAIGKSALAFLARYRSIAAAPVIPENFPAELADLEKTLRERIDREEATLYPMYLPAY